jgi:hypothetical protein
MKKKQCTCLTAPALSCIVHPVRKGNTTKVRASLPHRDKTKYTRKEKHRAT